MGKHLLSFLCCIFVASSTFATGISKSVLIGAKAIGMGGAFVAVADDPTAIFHNPAGMTQLEGHDFYIGADALITDLNYTPSGTTTTERAILEVLPVPAFGYVANIFEPVSFGLGIFFPHGNGGKFGSASAIASNPLEGRIYSMEITPAVAWKIMDELSIGASLRIVRAQSSVEGQVVILDENNPTTSIDSIQNLEVDGWDLGFAVGALYKPTEKLSIGVNFRSKVDMDLSGDVTFSSGGVAETLLGTDTTDVSNFKQVLPMNIQGGVAFYPIDGLTLALSYQYEKNSSIEEFSANFASGNQSLAIPQNWSDSSTIHVGADYWFHEQYGARVGYARDLDESIPDTAMTRIIGDIASNEVSAGLMYKTQNVDFGLTWNARFGERDVPLDGTNNIGPGNYEAFVQTISFGVGVDF